MKYLAFALTVVALTGAGCTQQEEVPKPASDDGIETSVPAKPQSDSAASVAAEAGVDRDVLAGVVDRLGRRVVVRYDRQKEMVEGKMEHQVFLEVVEGSVPEAETMVSDQLVTHGYLIGHRFEDENGVRQLFRKRGGAPVRALSRVKGVGPALKDSRAVGSIYIKQ